MLACVAPRRSNESIKSVHFKDQDEDRRVESIDDLDAEFLATFPVMLKQVLKQYQMKATGKNKWNSQEAQMLIAFEIEWLRTNPF